MSSSSQINQGLDQLLEQVPTEIRSQLKKKLKDVIFYTPKIGIMGKSGAGKSSLINALLGKYVCETGGVGGCTRHFQEEIVTVNNRQLVFMDLPGIAENTSYDDEYQRLYASKIKDLDLILWVIKVDDRANVNDQEFYKDLIQFYKKERILFVLSQCDKAEPSREFNRSTFTPSAQQQTIINKNRERLAKGFDVSIDDVIAVACDYYEKRFERWNFAGLATRIIHKIPKKAKTSMYASMPKENRTLQSKQESKSAFREVAETICDTVIDSLPMSDTVKEVLKEVGRAVIRKLADLIDL